MVFDTHRTIAIASLIRYLAENRITGPFNAAAPAARLVAETATAIGAVMGQRFARSTMPSATRPLRPITPCACLRPRLCGPLSTD